MNRNCYLTAPNRSTAMGYLPKVYLAGKIRKHCWRHKLVYDLRNHSWGDGPSEQSQFSYVGPFFIGCDHGCFHGDNLHGSIAIRGDDLCPGRSVNADFDSARPETVNLCLDAVRKSDLVFCYIDATDCHGTQVEIGYAIAHGIPLVIAFAPSIASEDNNDFWFGCARADWVIYGAREDDLKRYLAHSLRRYTWK